MGHRGGEPGALNPVVLGQEPVVVIVGGVEVLVHPPLALQLQLGTCELAGWLVGPGPGYWAIGVGRRQVEDVGKICGALGVGLGRHLCASVCDAVRA